MDLIKQRCCSSAPATLALERGTAGLARTNSGCERTTEPGGSQVICGLVSTVSASMVGLFGRVWDMLLGRKARGIACVASLSFWATPGIAANISLAPLDNDPAHAVVLLEGPLVSSDDAAFRSHVGRLTKAIVTFDSDGGSLLAGIAIGKTIRLKSFVTAVIDGQRCASACALAWLGGSPRLMGTRAYIGFHAAYVDKAGRASETGANHGTAPKPRRYCRKLASVLACGG